MNRTFCATAAIAGLLFVNTLSAQENTDTAVIAKNHLLILNKSDKPAKNSHILSLNFNGISFGHSDSAKNAADRIKKEHKHVTMSYAIVDLGLSIMMDNTNYTSPVVKGLLDVPANMQNKSLFDLRTWKSVNVNIYPWMVKFKAMKTKNQRIYISSGIGLQLYNFRYEDPITWTRNPVGVILDTISFKKDKLALNYLSMPLMFTFKTRLHKDNWLVYGAGVTEGFLVDSWTKQESGARGKVKVYDQFGLNQFNTCLTAELGIEGEFRLFFTYQVTSLFQNGLDQHPLSIGFRFGGI